jgi:hypothetical protein
MNKIIFVSYEFNSIAFLFFLFWLEIEKVLQYSFFSITKNLTATVTIFISLILIQS